MTIAARAMVESKIFGQCPGTHIVADLTGSDEEVTRAAFAVADSLYLGVHPALGATDQAPRLIIATLITPMLVAVL
jgi:hypothetical protein